jgi:hypothetical protein
MACAAMAFGPGTALALPTVDFTWTPSAPLTNQDVNFQSTSAPSAGGSIKSQDWDLDDDGKFNDDGGGKAKTRFSRPGTHRVGLRVVETNALGAEETDSKYIRVEVANRAPIAALAIIPSIPAPDQPFTLLSSSYDPDGFISSTNWDLDGDGKFDDASGTSIATSRPAGRHAIALKVTDDSGETGVTTAFVEVRSDSPATPTTTSSVQGGVRLLSPFPIVRVSGLVQRGGIKLRLLSVTAPVGSTVLVRCSGRGCPFKRSSRVVTLSGKASDVSPTRVVLVRRFARKLLRAGAAVRVYVTRPDAVGKYTRLRIRRNKPPARVDRCVTPASNLPFPCPPG